MKVLLTGATGFIGTSLTRKLEAAGHRVLPVSRMAAGAFDWSPESLAQGVQEADAVINLAGENLFAKRWSAAQKARLISSRVDGTSRLSALIARRKPTCFISASAVGYYGPNDHGTLTESSPPGSDFLAEVCRKWEGATEEASMAGVRTAIVRIGVVLGRGGGALAKMLPPFRLGLGGRLGHGKQWVSWVHLDDLASLVLFLLDQPSCSGAFNGTAPNPVTMGELTAALGKALHRPTLFPLPAPVLRTALGERADLFLTGQRVLPERAVAAGFRFRFENVQAALDDLVGRGR